MSSISSGKIKARKQETGDCCGRYEPDSRTADSNEGRLLVQKRRCPAVGHDAPARYRRELG